MFYFEINWIFQKYLLLNNYDHTIVDSLYYYVSILKWRGFRLLKKQQQHITPGAIVGPSKIQIQHRNI